MSGDGRTSRYLHTIRTRIRVVVPETPSHTLPPAPSASSVAKACRRRTGPSSWWRPGRVEMLMLLAMLVVALLVLWALYSRFLAAPLPSVLKAPLTGPPVSSRPSAP